MTSLRSFLGARIAFAIALLCAVSSSVEFARAESPTVSSATPQGGLRGTEVEVRFGGNNLGDDPKLITYYPGITVKSIDAVRDKKTNEPTGNAAVATLVIAPDCRPGIHAFRIRTASGLSPMPVLFSVGQLPETAETEPNNDAATAQAIKLDTTVDGGVGNEDTDYYAIEAKKGERISVEVEAMRLGRSLFDPLLILQDADGRELARSDDEAFGWYDAVLSAVAPKDGKYFVVIRETTFGNGSNYRLHIGRFPRPTAVVPAGGKPGETLEVTFLGDATGPWKKKITVPKNPVFYSTYKPGDERGTPLFAEDDKGASPTPLIFRVSDLDNVVESEPNDDFKTQANPGKAPIAFNGVIEKKGDVDCFEFAAKKGEVYEVRVHARSIRSPLDSVLNIYRKSNGSSAGNNDDSGSPDSYLRLNCPVDDIYIVSVKDMLDDGGVNFAYRIEVTPVEPSVRLTAAEKVQYIDTYAYVPQGNRAAVVLNAARRDYAGEIVLDVKGLPKGMKYETVPMASGQTLVPFLLTADDDAPLAPGILDITARATDEKYAGLTGHFSQDSQMLRGNNRPVYEHTIQRFSSAITKKAPFKIDVVQPKVPLVRNGSMDLKVKVKREPGFTAPINIRMLYNPNGTASAAAAKIDEGKDEGLLYVNAGSTADLREWKIVVLGSAQVGNGSIEVASQFVNLQVGEPYFDLTFKPQSVEQGKEMKFVIELENNAEFPGKAQLSLLGLPAETTCEPIEITKDATEAVFTIKTTAKTIVGRHKSVMCNLVVMQNGEPINHTLGPGEVRVDAPPKQVAANTGSPKSGNPATGGASKAAPNKPAVNANNNK